MTEDDAQAWIAQRFGAAAAARVAGFVGQVVAESSRQNLVSRASIDSIWARHVVDSAQLIALAREANAATRWLDVGSGAGFPGAIVALLTPAAVTLVEPRRRRAAFLADALRDIAGATVIAARVEAFAGPPQHVISARAVAPAVDLLDATRHLADISTCYILPRGRSAATELESARLRWHGLFHVEPSITDAESGILIAEKVRHR